MIENLFKVSVIRGRDATGFIAMTDPWDCPQRQRIITDKAPLPADEFVQKSSIWRGLRSRRCNMVLGHVRMATHGDPKENENNHPHCGEHLHLVHNGVVRGNHFDLADRYCVQLETDCDSEVLLRMVEKASTVPIGLSLCLRERPGSMVVYDSRKGILWLARDESRPLWICRLRRDTRSWFASTSGILIEALVRTFGKPIVEEIEQLFPLAPMHIFSLSPRGTFVAAFEDEVRPKVWT